MVNSLATALLAVSVLASSSEPVEWQSDYGKALEATKAGEQPLLVVLDKPEADDARMEPELMDEGAETGEEAELLRPYNLCHVDASSDYGQKVAKAFKADRFPHVAIIDKSGKQVIFHKSGRFAAKEWRDVLEKFRDGERPIRQVSYKVIGGTSSSFSNPNYCPSCQRRSM